MNDHGEITEHIDNDRRKFLKAAGIAGIGLALLDSETALSAEKSSRQETTGAKLMNPKTTALVLIEYQNDFTTPKGVFHDGVDNRGVMIRVLGGAGDAATRLENRVGEPAANPYLYMAAQVLAGLDGVDRKLDPGPSADTPYETEAPFLPKSLRDAVAAVKEDPFFREKFGAEFIGYYTHIKDAEIDRFLAEVTDWEHREYFEMF